MDSCRCTLGLFLGELTLRGLAVLKEPRLGGPSLGELGLLMLPTLRGLSTARLGLLKEPLEALGPEGEEGGLLRGEADRGMCRGEGGMPALAPPARLGLACCSLPWRRRLWQM